MNLTRAFAVLCLLLPRLASAGIAFDASSGLRESALNASSLTYPVTVGSGLTDRIVVVLVPAYASTNVSVSLITYGGVPLTRVRRDANGVQLAYSEAWYLLAPAAGLHNVVVTMTGPVGSENAIYSGALSFSGVDQTTPIDAHAGSVVTGSHGAHGDTITTVTAGAWVVDGVATRNPPAAGGNQTQRWSGGAAHLERSGGSTRGPIATAGATAMNWTWATSGGASAHSVVALKPSSAGVPDATPPVLSNGAPSGALPAGTTQATLSVTTNENAVCRYSTTPGTAYAAMTGTFTVTGATSHSTTLVNVADGNSYARYLRCQDAAGNANGVDYAVSFSIGASRFLTASNWAAFTPAANGVGTLPKGFKGGIFDGRYSHFIPNFNGNSEVMRYDTTAPFTAAASWATFDPNPPSGGGYVGGAFDGRYVYFAPYRNGSLSIGEVLRYDTQSPFTSQASWSTFDPSANDVGTSPKGYWGAFFDGRYIYFSPEHQTGSIQEHGEVLRYDTTLPFNQAASWLTYDAGAHGVGTDPDGYKGIASDGTYLYFVPYWNGTASHGEVLRYDRRGAFDVASSWATYTPAANGVGNIAKGFEGAVFDGRYLYFVPNYAGFGPNAYHGEVLRYDTLAPFQTASSWTAFDPGSNGVGTDPDGYNGATFDGRYIYFAPTNNGTGPHGEVLMYDTTRPFNSAASWLTYDPGARGIGADPDGFAGTIFDNRYIYFVPDRNETGVPGGEVLRYDTGVVAQTTTLVLAARSAASTSATQRVAEPAATQASAGRVFAEVDGPVNTRVTLANPNDAFVEVSFYFTDSDGRRVSSGSLVVPPFDQIAGLVDGAPFHAGPSFVGTFTFEASQPIAPAAVREFATERGERLTSPLPVVGDGAGHQNLPIAAGDGWSTQAVLVNPTDREISGSVVVSDDRVNYRIPAGSAWRLSTSEAGPLQRGYAVIDADAGSARPAGFALMSYRPQGTTVAESSVISVPETRAARVLVNSTGLQTSIGISNAGSDRPARVAVELTGVDGQPTGVRGVLEVPGRGQMSTLVNGIPGFESLPSSFIGVLRVTSSFTPVTVVGFQERTDERGAFLVGMLPAISEDGLGTSQLVVFSSGQASTIK
ncbi:MAG: hypothetical protein ABL971_11435 [Vicinamibacterales bacterium]